MLKRAADDFLPVGPALSDLQIGASACPEGAAAAALAVAAFRPGGDSVKIKWKIESKLLSNIKSDIKSKIKSKIK